MEPDAGIPLSIDHGTAITADIDSAALRVSADSFGGAKRAVSNEDIRREPVGGETRFEVRFSPPLVRPTLRRSQIRPHPLWSRPGHRPGGLCGGGARFTQGSPRPSVRGSTAAREGGAWLV